MYIEIGDKDCKKCELHETRNKLVLNKVNPNCEIAFVNTSGGLDENKEGKNLLNAIKKANVNPDDCSFLSCTLCFLSGDKLKRKNWQICYDNFAESMHQMPKLKLVVLLGVDVYKMISGKASGTMKDLFCQPFKLEEWNNIEFFPTYSPGSICYKPTPTAIDNFYSGIRRAIERLVIQKKLTKKFNSVIIREDADLRNILPYIEKARKFAVDTEFTSLQIWRSELICASFSWENNTAVGIPWKKYNKEKDCMEYYWNVLQQSEIRQAIPAIFLSGKSITTQNGKVESLIMRKEFGIKVDYKFDIMHKVYLDNSNLPANLKAITARMLPENIGWKEDFWGDVTDKELKDETWYKKKDLWETIELCNKDAANTFELTNILAKEF